MKTKYLICNLKENKTNNEIIDYEKQLENITYKDYLKLIICPSYLFLPFFKNDNYSLGSQDVSKFKLGSYTGEVSAKQLASLNVKYSIVGHYERRFYFNETKKDIVNKIKYLLENNIRPILFFGEENPLPEEETYLELENQLEEIFAQLNSNEIEKIILSYEPSWLIGQNNNLEIESIERIIKYLKNNIYHKYDKNLPILYGGGINEIMIKELSKIAELDGLCLGKSSLDIETVKKIYQDFLS